MNCVSLLHRGKSGGTSLPMSVLVTITMLLGTIAQEASAMDNSLQVSSANSESSTEDLVFTDPEVTSPGKWSNPANCSEEHSLFYSDVFTQAKLTRILLVGSPSEKISFNANGDYYLRVHANRVLKGDRNELTVLFNSNNRVPILVRFAASDTDTLLDRRCAALGSNQSVVALLDASESVSLGDKYFFFLDKTSDPTMFVPVFSPAERKSSVENFIKRNVLCSQPDKISCDLAPRLKISSGSVAIRKVGDSVSLPCSTTNPIRAVIYWTRVTDTDTDTGSALLNVGLSQSSRVKDEAGRLVIESAELHDAGTYRCNGRNLFGESSSDVELGVLSATEYDSRFPTSRSSTSTGSTGSTGLNDQRRSSSEEPTSTLLKLEGCLLAERQCKNGALCTENRAGRTFECVCPSGYHGKVCEFSSLPDTSSSSTARSTVAITASRPPVSDVFLAFLGGKRSLTTALVMYTVAAGSVLLLIAAVSIAVLVAWRFARRKRDPRSQFAKKQRGGNSQIFITPEAAVPSTTCVSLSNTNHGSSACSSSSSESDHKSPAASSHADIYVPNSASVAEVGDGHVSMKRSSKKRRFDHVVISDSRDLHMTELPTDEEVQEAFRSQSISSAMYNYAVDGQRVVHSRSSFTLAARNAHDRLLPVQEVFGNHDRDRPHVTNSLSRSRPKVESNIYAPIVSPIRLYNARKHVSVVHDDSP